jgi:hypothetical protein
MDRYIIPPLQEQLKFLDCERETACQNFWEFIMFSWEHKHFSYFLQETNLKNDSLQKSSEKLLERSETKLLDQRKSELDELSIKYKQSAITELKQLIQPHKTVLIFAPGSSTILTAGKIHHMLSATKHIILNLQQLIRFKIQVMLACQSRFDVTVLESQSLTKNSQYVFRRT